MPSGLRKGLTTYGDPGFSLFLRKAFIKATGYSDDALDRPIVGITDTCQRLQPLPRQRAAADRGGEARRDAGGRAADGVPDHLDPRVASPIRPRMYLRNLMAMDTEEMLRAQPMDAVVLIGGCDKTLPAQIMGAVERRHARHRGAGRPDGGRPPPAARCSAPAPTAAASGAQHRAGEIGRGRDRGRQRPARALGRHLHGDGHGHHHGLHDRGAGPVAALRGRHPGPACRAPALRARRPASAAVALATSGAPRPTRAAHAGRLPQRHGRAAGDRRLDQRHRASRRDRRPRRASRSTSRSSTGSDARCRC